MCGDRDVTIHTDGNIFGVGRYDSIGVLGIKNARGNILDTNQESSNSGVGEEVETNESGQDDGMISFTLVPLVGDSIVSWLTAARQHSSLKDYVLENLSWDGTAPENIEKYQREIEVEKGL